MISICWSICTSESFVAEILATSPGKLCMSSMKNVFIGLKYPKKELI